MESQLHSLGIGIVALIALQRAAYVHYVFFRRFLAYRKVAVSMPASWTDFVTYAEPPLMLAVTSMLWLAYRTPEGPTGLELLRVVLGVAIALAALALQLAALRSFPTMSVGHYVLPEHRIVRKGPYAHVRHPIYSQAILLWVSLAIGFASPAAAAVTVLYVIPAYLIYSRSEEEMLLDHFGDAYAAYRASTGAFLPRLGKRRRVAPTQ